MTPLPFQPLLNGAKIEIRWNIGGQDVFNILWATVDAPPVSGQLDDLGIAVDTAVDTFLVPILANTMLYMGLRVIDWSIEDGTQFIVDHGAGVPGGTVGIHIPANVAVTTTLQTNRTGRSYRGRTYLTGFVNGQISGNTAIAGLVTSIGNWWVGYAAAVDGASSTPVIASFVQNGVRLVQGVSTAIQTYRVNSQVATQRRRLPPIN